ncbi:unnamed protein product [Soboliphyme baturini]|uniref:Ras-associating domain-containing protein n=1 Tax=Soboliphyme baturini TaxID=241478 RepID=A0A183IGI9_9BILA|nr:unnamed protein product [Soboliphyme baturini]
MMVVDGAEALFVIESAVPSKFPDFPPKEDMGTIKVYTSELQPGTDYKTLFVSTNTSADEMIQLVLAKFGRQCRDPNLFYLTMELNTKYEGASVSNSLVLDRDAKPLELQACHPKEMSKFLLHVRPSFQIRVYDHCLHSASNYKSLLISNKTTCLETIRLVLKMNKVSYAAEEFNIVLKNIITGARHQLPHDLTLASVESYCTTGAYQLHLKAPPKPMTISRRCLVGGAFRPPFLIDEDPFSGLASELANFI